MKVKVNLKLKSKEENYEKELFGSYRGNKICFIDDKVRVSLTLGEVTTMRRVSNEYEIVLNFKDNT